MKLITQSPYKVVVKVEMGKIEDMGFDYVWDGIRVKFPESTYNSFNIEVDESGESVFIELFKKRSTKSKDKKEVVEEKK